MRKVEREGLEYFELTLEEAIEEAIEEAEENDAYFAVCRCDREIPPDGECEHGGRSALRIAGLI